MASEKQSAVSATAPSSSSSTTPSTTTHHIKKMLESYKLTAGHTITGPDKALSSTKTSVAPDDKDRGSHPSYRLPPDVELSKTSDKEAAYMEPLELKKEAWRLANGGATLSKVDLRPTPSQMISSKACSTRLGKEGRSSPLASSLSTRIITPIFSARDCGGRVELKTCDLWGVEVAGFNVGGEMRLCLPQIHNTLLDKIDLADIKAAEVRLKMNVPPCSSKQLELLKQYDVLPSSTTSCQLVTRSDAERLCSTLLDRDLPLGKHMGFNAGLSPFSYKVQHECFGTCVGLLLPEAYTGPNAHCIECLECGRVLQPSRFVCHSHASLESDILHWGFDSNHWRSFIHVWDGYVAEDPALEVKFQRKLDDFKTKFLVVVSAPSKRKATPDATNSSSAKTQTVVVAPKRSRLSHDENVTLSSQSASSSARSSLPASTIPQAPTSVDPRSEAYGWYIQYNSWSKAQQQQPAPQPTHQPSWPPATVKPCRHSPPPLATPTGPSLASVHRDVSPTPVHRLMERRSSMSPPLHQPRPSSSLKSSPSSLPYLEQVSPHVGHSQATSHFEDPQGVLPVHRGEESRGLDLHFSRPSRHASESRGSRRMRSNGSSMAADISEIRNNLDGASPLARERILEVLGRIVSSVTQAEAERDDALNKAHVLHRRLRETEEELDKKSAEVRTLLRQDVHLHHNNFLRHPDEVDDEAEDELRSRRRVSAHLQHRHASPHRGLGETSRMELEQHGLNNGGGGHARSGSEQLLKMVKEAAEEAAMGILWKQLSKRPSSESPSTANNTTGSNGGSQSELASRRPDSKERS